MYRTGHYGAALLVYAPVGGALLAAGFDAAALVGGAVVVGLSGLPDVDQRIPFVEHRGPTHTVGFLVLVALAVGGAGVAVGEAVATEEAVLSGDATASGAPVASGGTAALGAFGFLLGSLAVASHLLADALTPMGITPFRPLSDAHYTLALTRADNAAANYLLLGLGVAVTVATALVAGG
ncbi:metal-dependent hydrolase [Halosimplex pelagicum]|uniref:Metal-dependent hydrolase n=1 Tax=Halosimplex pelagicum TaxID=869886 RepID=A0A7D5TDE5_9EURY|nr:metal-dependent hydrolase [Halosimplex pelagicum]QLH83709.1 metal-dependent hydrolase [Halosimplex pelagicum]